MLRTLLSKHGSWLVPAAIMAITFFGGWYVNGALADQRAAIQLEHCQQEQAKLEAEVERLRTASPTIEGVSRAEYTRKVNDLEGEIADLRGDLQRWQRRVRRTSLPLAKVSYHD